MEANKFNKGMNMYIHNPIRAALCVALLALHGACLAAPIAIPLDAVQAPANAAFQAAQATFEGKNVLRLTDMLPAGVGDEGRLLELPLTQFKNGTIELEMSGDVKPGAASGARGFVGLAFRVKAGKQFELFYLRPTNGRANDQLRRNHTLQYVSSGYTWDFLREKFPGRYESYADMVPGKLIPVRITVEGTKARLYINNASQPALVLDDLKQGESEGSIALWVGPGTVAHFTALRIDNAAPAM
jgi:hypothetical protein